MNYTSRRYIVAVIIFIIIFSTSNFAQNGFTISGTVTDSISGKVIPGAKIYFSYDNGKIDSTISDFSGIWKYEANITAINDNNLLPDKFNVSENYPNPFNPSTTVDVTIPNPDYVKVKVFNTIGELVNSHTEFLDAGTYSIRWNSGQSAGVYFINIGTKYGSITRKVVQTDGGHGSGLSKFIPGKRAHTQASKISVAIPIKISALKYGYVSKVFDTQVSDGDQLEIKLESIHSHATLVDLHNDILEKLIVESGYHLKDRHDYNHTDIPRMQEGGVDVQFFAVWVAPGNIGSGYYNQTLAMVNIFKKEISDNQGTIGQATTAAQAEALVRSHKIAAVLAIEGGHSIENVIGKLIHLYNEGARYLTITWNNSTDWAVSAQDSRSETVGLSEFGKRVIRTMDSLGMIIDVSHTGIKTIEDILSITKNPIIASHSGARALRDHYRDLYDEQIKAIANSGGVVGVVFYPPFLVSSNHAYVDDVVDHIDYIVNLVGIDYVALGSDFDGIGTNTVVGLDNISKYPLVTIELLRRGYTQGEIEKILGGNFLRVFGKVCGN